MVTADLVQSIFMLPLAMIIWRLLQYMTKDTPIAPVVGAIFH